MTGTPAPTPIYHPAVDRILARLLGDTGEVAELRRAAEAPDCEPLTSLLHDAALRAGERDFQLTRKIKHTLADLKSAAAEVADARPAEHLLTGRHDELLALAARHHDSLTHLGKLAQAHAATRSASN